MNRKGFTLIELLIVVVIIGILAAIAIPKFSNTKEKALVSGMKSDLRNYASAQESYYADYTTYAALSSLQGAPYNFKLSGANAASGNGASGTTWSLALTNAGVATATTDNCHVSGGTGSTDEGVPTCD
jgi:prepilin-type N-terminal cleavage/methylation domain-containing protein